MRFFSLKSLFCNVSLLALLFLAPGSANAGEYIRSVSFGSGYRTSGGSMTRAQRQVSVPLTNRGVSKVEGSYHGANYYSYKSALKQYKQSLVDYEQGLRTGSYQVHRDGNRIQPRGLRAIRARPVNQNRTSRSQAVPVQKAVYTKRAVVVPAKSVIVASPQVEYGTPSTSYEETRSARELSLLADPAKSQPPIKSKSDKDSIWTHFRRALGGK